MSDAILESMSHFQNAVSYFEPPYPSLDRLGVLATHIKRTSTDAASIFGPTSAYTHFVSILIRVVIVFRLGYSQNRDTIHQLLGQQCGNTLLGALLDHKLQ